MGWTLLLVPSLLLLGLWWPCCGGASNATWAGRRLLVQPVHARPASPAYNEWDDVRPADRELAELHMVPRKRLRGGHHVAKLRVSKHGSGSFRGERPAWWKGPPLLSPWRNMGPQRMRAGWKYATHDNAGTIFVSLVSFRDDKCPRTLVELFSKARWPERITVGLVQQNTEGDVDCFREYCRLAGRECRRHNVRMIRMPAEESRGVMVVRHLASTLFEGEQYFLQVDAHCLFYRDWDHLLIQDLKRVPNNERVVLSHHPPAATSANDFNEGGSAINICKYTWDGNGLPRFSAEVVQPPVYGTPFPGVFIGAGMVFARSELLIDCPFDFHLPYLFSGEELLLAACAWSHGWDIYNPSFAPLFHFYKDSNTMKIHNPFNDEIHSKSMKRLKFALGVQGAFEDLPAGEWQEDFDRFGMANARPLNQYYIYAGIDWETKGEQFPFCKLRRPKSEYKFHETAVDNIPALEELSYDKGCSPRWPSVEILTGDQL